jgi:glutamate formiminotransferase/formiminotetrahydrofolate cyclodeaminase
MKEIQLIECVPNFSEGRDPAIIQQITEVISDVEGVRLLDVDPGKATNRTVVTFVGEPAPVIEAAFRAIQKAAEAIDMSDHQGEHPRMGATDVCPLVPIANISMAEVVKYAHQLAGRVGRDLKIPVYLYESAAQKPERKNLAAIRAGEYEGLKEKLQKPEWAPDFGPAVFNPGAGATVIGARDFLVAYNVNLNTSSVRRANSVAFDIREKGRIKREGNSITGKIVRDSNGEPVRQPGTCKSVKAIGWYIKEYGIAQISMNLTDINQTSLHAAFEACRKSATKRGMRVTGSELVGLIPLKVILDAGKYFLQKQKRSTGIPDDEIIKLAVKSLGLDEIKPFDPAKKIIEYLLREKDEKSLVSMTLRQFVNETASESPTPGGGSVSAQVGALGAALGAMVANLSAHKRGWDDRWETFSSWAEKGQKIKEELLYLVDADTSAFNEVMAAFRLSANTEKEKMDRNEQIQLATQKAIEIPFRVMRIAASSFPLLLEMAVSGNPNSVSDAAVGAICSRAAIRGAWLNVQINAPGLDDKDYLKKILIEAEKIAHDAEKQELEILNVAKSKLN